MQINVIDVSSWQGNIDFAKVKSSGISAVIIRCGLTGYRTSLPVQADSMFEKNYKGATAAGLEVGVYYYSCATTVEKATEEAEFTLKQIAGKKVTYPVYFDTEDNHKTSAGGVNPQNQVTIGKTALTAIAKEFCGIIRDAGYIAGVYSSVSWLETHINMSELSEYETWAAQYYSVCQYKGPYQMWQYTGTGSVPGVSGNVDKSYCYKEYGAGAPDVPGIVQYPMQRNAISAGFDYLTYKGATKFHYAIDISRTQNQTYNVFAAHSGTVLKSEFDSDRGNYVVVSGYFNEKIDIVSRYNHLAKNAVKQGSQIKRGDVVGVQGDTGNIDAQHLEFATWLVPKNYSYDPADAEKYAVDPVSVCRVMPGQVFPFVGAESHNFSALSYPRPKTDKPAGLTNMALKLTGEGIGLYVMPADNVSPLVGGKGRSRATAVKFCGNLQYKAVQSCYLSNKQWVLIETCMGSLWAPVIGGRSELVHSDSDDTGSLGETNIPEDSGNEAQPTAADREASPYAGDCEKKIADIKSEFGDAIARMKAIIHNLPPDQ